MALGAAPGDVWGLRSLGISTADERENSTKGWRIQRARCFGVRIVFQPQDEFLPACAAACRIVGRV
jgi:hypothetical protein